MAGILIPNFRYFIDTDFDPDALADWYPDGWEADGATPGLTVRHTEGLDAYRALHINSTAGAGIDNFFLSPRSPRGSVPIFEFTGQSIFLRLVFWWRHSNTFQTLEPRIVFYNRDESKSIEFTPWGALTSLAGTWLRFDAVSSAIDVSTATLAAAGWVAPYKRVSHCRLRFRVGGAATASVFGLASGTLGYRTTDPRSSQGYDALTARPIVAGLVPEHMDLGAFNRTTLGQGRWLDATGGVEAVRLRLHYEALLEADRKVWDAAWRHCQGKGPKPISTFSATGTIVPPVNPGPIVVEPFLFDPPAMSAGRYPENFYAWLTGPPMPEWRGYLGNISQATLMLEEAG